MAILEGIGTGIVANYIYDTAKAKLPEHLKTYVPALFNSDPAYLFEAERLLEEAVDDLRSKYGKYKTVQIFLGGEKLRREGVLRPVLDYLLNSGPNPESQIRKSLEVCVVAREFPISRGTRPVEFGKIVREITRTVEQKFRTSERLVGFLSNSCLDYIKSKLDSLHHVAKNDLSKDIAREIRSDNFDIFLTKYVDDLKGTSKNLRIHGVERITSKGTLSQDLGSTYIDVEAACPGHERSKSKSFLSPFKSRFNAREAIDRLQKIVFKGPAGSGKTTVLQKIILDSSLENISGIIPIYIPLRRLEAGYTEDWTIEITLHRSIRNPLIQSNVPIDVVDQFKSLNGRVCFLLDGLDELSERTREKFWQLVEDIERRLPEARIVITTRALSNVHHSDGTVKDSIYADRASLNRARQQWRPSPDFFEFTIGDLTNTQISIFIDRWFDGVDPDTRSLAGRDADWAQLPHKLKAVLFTLPHEDTLNLARSPLICSLVCLIFFLRDGTLPSSKRQLYEMATQLLIEIRDSARDVRLEHKFQVIDLERRESLLQSIALEMQEGDTEVDSQSIEVSRISVERIAKKWLEDHKFHGIGESELVGMLIERCAIIREPSAGMVDFVHRSFMEFLAANEIVLKRGPHSVRSKIENEQWIATLTFAMNTPQGGVYFGGSLISELVSYVKEKYKKPQQRHILRNLAYRIASLLDHRAEYPINCHDKIRELCEIVLPPSTMSEAFDCREIPISYLGEVIDYTEVAKISDSAVKASGFLLAQHEDPRSSEYLASGFQEHGDQDLISAINFSGRVPFSLHNALLKRVSNGSYRKKVYLTADELQSKTNRAVIGQEIGVRFPFHGKEFVGWDILRKARDVTLIGPNRRDWDALITGQTQKFRSCSSLEIVGGADFNFSDIASIFPVCKMIILEDCRHFSAEGLEKLRSPEAIEFRRISYPITIDLNNVNNSIESIGFYSCAEVQCDPSENNSIEVRFDTI